MVTSDVWKSVQPPTDKFKQGRVPKPPAKPVADKPNNVNKCEPLPRNKVKKKKAAMRWSEVQLKHTRMKNRLLDEPALCGDLYSDNAPLYSSFGRNGVFDVPARPKRAASRVK